MITYIVKMWYEITYPFPNINGATVMDNMQNPQNGGFKTYWDYVCNSYPDILQWLYSCQRIKGLVQASIKIQGPVLLTLLRHVPRILANGRAAFFESCDTIGWNSCDTSQKR